MLHERLEAVAVARQANPQRCPSASTRRSPPRAPARASPSRSGSATTALDARRLELRRPLGGPRGPAHRMLGKRPASAQPAAPAPDYEDARHVAPATPRRARRRSSSRHAWSAATWARMSASVTSGAAAGPAAAVLGLDHLVHVVDLELGLDLGGAGRAPVHLLGSRAGIPAPDREEDPEQRPARRARTNAVNSSTRAECTLPPHARRRHRRRPAHADRPLRRRARARPARRPCRPRDRGSGRAQRDRPREPWTRSTWAARTRRARTTATWRVWRR